jgi:hypothetical protein
MLKRRRGSGRILGLLERERSVGQGRREEMGLRLVAYYRYAYVFMVD